MEVIEKLLSVNEYSRPGRKLREKRAVILHWVGVGGQRAETVWNFFENARKEKHYSSAHYCVDLDGTVYRFVPDDEVAYHCGSSQIDPKSGKIYTDWAREVLGAAALHPERDSPNNVTLGIEMCATGNDGALDPRTVAAAAELTAELCGRYGIPVDRVGTHHLVVGWKDCPRLWTRYPGQFEEFRQRVEGLI
ncbi:MAG: N-acetylmuramoyl-L-alanine amidase [Treponema sp.]|jgi:N-acetylmuramoyl-L-alanine amidase|nr:N-acetylmuramoyl-L-alanine amidase [Treponema sp.]